MSLTLCGNCLDTWTNHTLRQRRRCLAALEQAGETVDVQELPKLPKSATQLKIPKEIREGRQRAVAASRRGQKPAPKDVKARREYSKLRREQLPREKVQAEGAASREARAKRVAKIGRAEVIRHRTHRDNGRGRPACGAEGTRVGDPYDCKRCARPAEPPRRIRVHFAAPGRSDLSLCQRGDLEGFTTTVVDDVECGTCLRRLRKPVTERAVRSAHRQVLADLAAAHPDEYQDRLRSVLADRGYDASAI